MRIEGRLVRVGRRWAVEIPMLSLYTQASSKSDAYEMAKDAIEVAVDTDGFSVEIVPGRGDTFGIESNDDRRLFAFALRQLRMASGRSVREVARRLGSTSPSAYSQYESGRRKPSVEKLDQLIRAIDENLVPVISLA